MVVSSSMVLVRMTKSAWRVSSSQVIPILYEDAPYEPPCSPPLVREDGVSRGVKYVAVSSRNGMT
jgi:hypothetical protein